ncbi:MAG TPA: glycoside hydrolase family 27 protein [Terriglobales bacterium]|nr:glycoside hydrolase family 27 protein [Terriglobales bacterium]
MKSHKVASVIFMSLLMTTSAELRGQNAGSKFSQLTPPMGWNSWDGYGTTISEAQFKANADWFAKHLKSFGWQYVVVDMEWFVTNPIPEGNSKSSEYSIDEYGRYIPAPNRFSSSINGAGFRPLADYVHSLGLKFGIHILRGIPKQAVEKNLPIAGSSFHAADAADTSDTCPWNYDNYGVNGSKPAGQSYYDSIAQLYAGWGLDFLKVDCISSRPYKGDEIRMLSTALRKTHRPIVLSLSPGPAPIEKVEEMRNYAQMWRISNDIWDLWHNDKDYPKGVGDQFGNVAKWTSFSEPGHWPDADMLPVGYLGPAPGWGKPRYTRLTHEEQRTLMTLWSIFRSPLMIGGDLTAADEWTTALLTNSEVIDVDQRSADARLVSSADALIVWSAKSAARKSDYVAIFNTSSEPLNIQHAWKELGFNAAHYHVRDLWMNKDLGLLPSVKLNLAAHGCILYSLTAK